MEAILSLGLGYLIGCISPAAMIGKHKNVDLKQSGTKNLGASNTTLVLGKAAGVIVLIFDIFKAFFSYRLARVIFPGLAFAGMLAGIGVILGHCFPVFLRFQGGKGLAAYGGLVLAFNPWIFLVLLTLGSVLTLITNYGVLMALSAGSLFPVLVFMQSRDVGVTVLAAAAGIIIIVMHRDNMRRARKHDEIKVKEFFSSVFAKKDK